MDERLWVACQQLLSCVSDALDDVGLLPDVTLVQLGPGWSWDPCERLVVHPENVQAVQLSGGTSVPATQSPPSQGCAVRPLGRVVATLLHCVPKVGDGSAVLPPPASITAASQRLHEAGMTMWKAVARGRVDGTLGEDCTAVTLEDMTATGASGGYAGWRLPVVLDLSGMTSGS